MKIEYIILIILAIGFYETSIKADIKNRKDREFINNNLDIGSKVTSKSGIIGEVISIDRESIVIISGDKDSQTHIRIKKSEINSIIG